MISGDDIRKRMQGILDLVNSDISSIRTGRVTPALVEEIEVSVYAGEQKLKVKELATISSLDSQTLQLEPWDKSITSEIKNGIFAANVGITPVVDGGLIRISFPPLTSEDRNKYVKLLATKLENGRVMIRQVRGDAMRDIKKGFEEKKITEDEKFNQEKRLQELTDEFIEKIDEVGVRKKQELSEL